MAQMFRGGQIINDEGAALRSSANSLASLMQEAQKIQIARKEQAQTAYNAMLKNFIDEAKSLGYDENTLPAYINGAGREKALQLEKMRMQLTGQGASGVRGLLGLGPTDEQVNANVENTLDPRNMTIGQRMYAMANEGLLRGYMPRSDTQVTTTTESTVVPTAGQNAPQTPAVAPPDGSPQPQAVIDYERARERAQAASVLDKDIASAKEFLALDKPGSVNLTYDRKRNAETKNLSAYTRAKELILKDGLSVDDAKELGSMDYDLSIIEKRIADERAKGAMTRGRTPKEAASIVNVANANIENLNKDLTELQAKRDAKYTEAKAAADGAATASTIGNPSAKVAEKKVENAAAQAEKIIQKKVTIERTGNRRTEAGKKFYDQMVAKKVGNFFKALADADTDTVYALQDEQEQLIKEQSSTILQSYGLDNVAGMKQKEEVLAAQEKLLRMELQAKALIDAGKVNKDVLVAMNTAIENLAKVQNSVTEGVKASGLKGADAQTKWLEANAGAKQSLDAAAKIVSEMSGIDMKTIKTMVATGLFAGIINIFTPPKTILDTGAPTGNLELNASRDALYKSINP